MATKSRRTSNLNVSEFDNFFRGWIVLQETYLEEIRSTLRSVDTFSDDDLRDLIARVLAHYQEYYEMKSRIANYDVSLVFSPPWFSCFERSFFWIAGFKPGLAFRIVRRSVEDVSEEQAERMERLRSETAVEEKELENLMATVQESVAGPAVVQATRRGVRSLVDGMYDELDSAIEDLKGSMEAILAGADMLRTRTAERVVEVLTPVQNLKFLAAATELQLKIRMLGWEIDGEGRR